VDNENRRMFNRSFQRPKDFFKLSASEQWAIDKRLGILDWDFHGWTQQDKDRYDYHYTRP